MIHDSISTKGRLFALGFHFAASFQTWMRCQGRKSESEEEDVDLVFISPQTFGAGGGGK